MIVGTAVSKISGSLSSFPQSGDYKQHRTKPEFIHSFS